MDAPQSTSTRPYLIRALYEWCNDNGLTPYVAVLVDETTRVPREYVKNGEIVLNISFDATSALKLGNEYIEFKARFSGHAQDIFVPVGRVIAIYARENGQGMAFPQPASEGRGDEGQRLSAGPEAVDKWALARSELRAVQVAPPLPASEASDQAPATPVTPAGAKGGRASLKRIK
ncbi:MAG: ClpXP protease specificity-enhancing factor [Burkholderiaceae bacterium]